MDPVLNPPVLNPDALGDVFDSLLELCSSRGNLTQIKNIIKEYNEDPLVRKKFDINICEQNAANITLFGMAIAYGQFEYLQWFIDNGAWKVSSNNETPLHMAISRSTKFRMDWGPRDRDEKHSASMTVVTLLHILEAKNGLEQCNLDPPWEYLNDWKKTPLDYSARKGGSDVLRLFLSKGAKVNGPLYDTQFHDIGIGRRFTYDPPRRSGSDLVNLYSQFGTTLLHQAIEHFNMDAFKLLLFEGANTHVYDERGETPLMCAIRWTNLEAVRLLIELRPSINISQIHGRAFVYLSDVGYWPTTSSASEQEKQYPGWTALHNAAELAGKHDWRHIYRAAQARGDPVEIIKILLNAGADVFAQNDEGKTPRQIAESSFKSPDQEEFDHIQINEVIDILNNAEDINTWSDTHKTKMRNMFMLAQHDRAGHNSWIHNMPENVIKPIFDGMTGPPRPDNGV